MITSTSNAQIKELAKLQKKSRLRDEKGIFLVEGPRMTEEIPAERIEKVYASESFAKKNKEFLEKLQAPVELLTDTVFAYVSDTKTPQGILAIVKRLNYTMNDLMQVKNQKAPHLVVLDNLQDPGNLGTIFRTAEAAGVTGILLSKDCVDVYNPKVIRSTMGAVFRMPFLYVEDLPEKRIIAARFQKTDRYGMIWTSDFVLNLEEKRLSVRLDQEVTEQTSSFFYRFSTV